MDDVKAAIRRVPDFPKPGVLFYDITTILQDPKHFKKIVDELVHRYGPMNISKILSMESRGFIFAAPLAASIGAGLVPLRNNTHSRAKNPASNVLPTNHFFRKN